MNLVKDEIELLFLGYIVDEIAARSRLVKEVETYKDY